MRCAPVGSILLEEGEPLSFRAIPAGAVRGPDRGQRRDHIPCRDRQATDLLLPVAVLNGQPSLDRAQVRDVSQLILIHADAFLCAVTNGHIFCLAASGVPGRTGPSPGAAGA